MVGHKCTALRIGCCLYSFYGVEWFLRFKYFYFIFITISERQEERLKNNNRDLSMVRFIRVIASLAYFS